MRQAHSADRTGTIYFNELSVSRTRSTVQCGQLQSDNGLAGVGLYESVSKDHVSFVTRIHIGRIREVGAWPEWQVIGWSNRPFIVYYTEHIGLETKGFKYFVGINLIATFWLRCESTVK
jgi:hypothetical protein